MSKDIGKEDLCRCVYNDCINEVDVIFYSDAMQSTISSLEFNGDWCIVKGILLESGYTIIEEVIGN